MKKDFRLGLIIFLGILIELFLFSALFFLKFSKPKTSLISLSISAPKVVSFGKAFKVKVFSQGEPLQGVEVRFGGKVLFTNNSGEVSFIPQKCGSFKIIAQKKGFKKAKKLILVSAPGNEKLKIRSIRYHPEHCECFPYRYVLSGANFATIKIYFLLDEKGNIYPSLGPFLGKGKWFRVPSKEQFNFLAKDIEFLRGFGLKIFAHGQIFPASRYEVDLDKKAKENFAKQWKKIAIEIAKFAQKEKIEILDPFGMGSGVISFPKQIAIYKEILPKLRQIYQGKLTASIPPEAFKDWDKLDYSEFDMISPFFFISVKASLKEIEDYFKEILTKARKIKKPIFPIWVIRTPAGPEAKKFLKNFKSLKEARIWYLSKAIEIIKGEKNVIGLSAYSVYPGRRLEVIEGEKETFIWQDKSLFNIVKENFTPGCYENNLAPFLENIKIDGKVEEWEDLDPVFYNPSGVLPDYSNFYHKKIFGEEFNPGILKAVYSARDSNYLYLMFEFYKLQDSLPELYIDSNNDGLYDFLVHLGPFSFVSIRKVVYKEDLLTEIDLKLQKFLSKIKFARKKNFIEVKIPLSLLDKEIGFKVAPEMAPGFCASLGGIEIKVKK